VLVIFEVLKKVEFDVLKKVEFDGFEVDLTEYFLTGLKLAPL
jgi:hypothetical protein